MCTHARATYSSVVARNVQSAENLSASIDHASHVELIGYIANIQFNLGVWSGFLDQSFCIFQLRKQQVDQEKLLAAAQCKFTRAALPNACHVSS